MEKSKFDSSPGKLFEKNNESKAREYSQFVINIMRTQFPLDQVDEFEKSKMYKHFVDWFEMLYSSAYWDGRFDSLSISIDESKKLLNQLTKTEKNDR